MVKTPKMRHSKSRREPVTIELEPGAVSRIVDEDAARPQAVAEEALVEPPRSRGSRRAGACRPDRSRALGACRCRRRGRPRQTRRRMPGPKPPNRSCPIPVRMRQPTAPRPPTTVSRTQPPGPPRPRRRRGKPTRGAKRWQLQPQAWRPQRHRRRHHRRRHRAGRRRRPAICRPARRAGLRFRGFARRRQWRDRFAEDRDCRAEGDRRQQRRIGQGGRAVGGAGSGQDRYRGAEIGGRTRWCGRQCRACRTGRQGQADRDRGRRAWQGRQRGSCRSRPAQRETGRSRCAGEISR